MSVIFSLVLALMPVAFPAEQPRDLVSQKKQDSSIPIKDLRNAPTTVVVNNRSLHLSAYAWRDFSPGIGTMGDRSLSVAVKITSADNQPLQVGLRMQRAWILFGEQVWEVSNLRGGKPGQDEVKDSWIGCGNGPECQVSLRGGPMWEPGVYIDVVLRLTDSEGKAYLIQAPNQKIIATS